MEKNNFNKAYLSITGIFAIGLAISNIINFFNGVGFALVASLILLFLCITNVLKDDQNRKRFGDIFVLLALEFVMMFILFFSFDLSLNGFGGMFTAVVRNVCSIFSMLSLGYVLFRYVSEVKGKRYNWVEYMLGNYTPSPKQPKEKKVKQSKDEVKKNKELENGTLEPKPASIETTESKEESVEEVQVEQEQPSVDSVETVSASDEALVSESSVQETAVESTAETSNETEKAEENVNTQSGYSNYNSQSNNNYRW